MKKQYSAPELEVSKFSFSADFMLNDSTPEGPMGDFTNEDSIVGFGLWFQIKITDRKLPSFLPRTEFAVLNGTA